MTLYTVNFDILIEWNFAKVCSQPLQLLNWQKKKPKMSEFLFYLIFDMCTYMEYLFYPKQKDPMEDMDFYKW